jgi:hypothetical protein
MFSISLHVIIDAQFYHSYGCLKNMSLYYCSAANHHKTEILQWRWATLHLTTGNITYHVLTCLCS